MLLFSQPRLLALLTWLVVAIWTIVVGASFVWTMRYDEKETMNSAYAEAKANLQKDITLRRWASDHGGVYVPITEKQRSIPWLSHVPGRDVTTTDGRQLTLLNPASVVRQMMDRYAQDYGVRGRITGLKYLNPGNAPDPWEKIQLEAFTRGEMNEVWEVAKLDGQPYLRYLRAMVMEPGCEKCHAILGYKLGDMRGATGLNLPLSPYYARIDLFRRNLGVTHGAIWLLGLLGIGFFSGLVRRRERDLEESSTTFRKILEASSDAVLLQGSTAVFVDCNQAALDLLKMTRAQLLQITPDQISVEFQPNGRCSAEYAQEMTALGRKGFHRFEWTYRNQEGGEFIVEVSLMPITTKGKDMLHCTWRDITERKRMEEQARQLAFFDSLTGLPNRRLLNDRLNQAMAASRRSGCFGALLFIDLDNFKPLNDAYGHSVGDLLLIEVANRLRNGMREIDTVARLGGDEFVVIVNELDAGKTESIAQARAFAEKIRIALAAPYRPAIHREGETDRMIEHRCTATIGVTVFFNHEKDPEDILKRADAAMYQAKVAGRNLILVYDEMA